MNFPLFDICENRHRNSPESQAANPSIESKRASYAVILGLLKERPMTAKEIATAMGTTINCVSGRLSEMRLVLKVIAKTGIRREGSAELEVVR